MAEPWCHMSCYYYYCQQPTKNLTIQGFLLMILFVVLLEMLKLNVQGIAYRYCTMLYENTLDPIKISVKLMHRIFHLLQVAIFLESYEVIDDISLNFGFEQQKDSNLKLVQQHFRRSFYAQVGKKFYLMLFYGNFNYNLIQLIIGNYVLITFYGSNNKRSYSISGNTTVTQTAVTISTTNLITIPNFGTGKFYLIISTFILAQ